MGQSYQPEYNTNSLNLNPLPTSLISCCVRFAGHVQFLATPTFVSKMYQMNLWFFKISRVKSCLAYLSIIFAACEDVPTHGAGNKKKQNNVVVY